MAELQDGVQAYVYYGGRDGGDGKGLLQDRIGRQAHVPIGGGKDRAASGGGESSFVSTRENYTEIVLFLVFV